MAEYNSFDPIPWFAQSSAGEITAKFNDLKQRLLTEQAQLMAMPLPPNSGWSDPANGPMIAAWEAANLAYCQGVIAEMESFGNAIGAYQLYHHLEGKPSVAGAQFFEQFLAEAGAYASQYMRGVAPVDNNGQSTGSGYSELAGNIMSAGGLFDYYSRADYGFATQGGVGNSSVEYRNQGSNSGSTTQTFDDGSTLTVNGDGSVTSTDYNGQAYVPGSAVTQAREDAEAARNQQAVQDAIDEDRAAEASAEAQRIQDARTAEENAAAELARENSRLASVAAEVQRVQEAEAALALERQNAQRAAEASAEAQRIQDARTAEENTAAELARENSRLASVAAEVQRVQEAEAALALERQNAQRAAEASAEAQRIQDARTAEENAAAELARENSRLEAAALAAQQTRDAEAAAAALAASTAATTDPGTTTTPATSASSDQPRTGTVTTFQLNTETGRFEGTPNRILEKLGSMPLSADPQVQRAAWVSYYLNGGDTEAAGLAVGITLHYLVNGEDAKLMQFAREGKMPSEPLTAPMYASEVAGNFYIPEGLRAARYGEQGLIQGGFPIDPSFAKQPIWLVKLSDEESIIYNVATKTDGSMDAVAGVVGNAFMGSYQKAHPDDPNPSSVSLFVHGAALFFGAIKKAGMDYYEETDGPGEKLVVAGGAVANLGFEATIGAWERAMATLKNPKATKAEVGLAIIELGSLGAIVATAGATAATAQLGGTVTRASILDAIQAGAKITLEDVAGLMVPGFKHPGVSGTTHAGTEAGSGAVHAGGGTPTHTDAGSTPGAGATTPSETGTTGAGAGHTDAGATAGTTTTPHDPTTDALRTGTVASDVPVGNGQTAPHILTLDNGEKGIWKAAANTSEGISTPRAEVGSSLIDRQLGQDLVPPTVFRDLNGVTGSYQRYAANLGAELDAANMYLPGYPPQTSFFDTLIGNMDRHGGNYLLSPDGRPILIDNGNAFQRLVPSADNFNARVDQALNQSGLSDVERMTQLRDLMPSRSVYDRLVGTSEAEWRNLLGSTLNPNEVDFFLANRSQAISTVEGLQARFGNTIFDNHRGTIKPEFDGGPEIVPAWAPWMRDTPNAPTNAPDVPNSAVAGMADEAPAQSSHVSSTPKDTTDVDHASAPSDTTVPDPRPTTYVDYNTGNTYTTPAASVTNSNSSAGAAIGLGVAVGATANSISELINQTPQQTNGSVSTSTEFTYYQNSETVVTVSRAAVVSQIQESVVRNFQFNPDQVTLDRYMGLMAEGYSLEKLDAKIISDGQLIKELFENHLDREANGGDYAYWFNAFAQVKNPVKLEELFVASAFPIVIEEPPVKTPTLPAEPTLVEVQGAAVQAAVDPRLVNPQVFDPAYYLATYSDLQNAFGNDYEAARNHWLSNGINEGRHGSAQFASTSYLANYGDIANAYGSTNYKDAILHYVSNGINEGRMGVSAPTTAAADQRLTDPRVFDPAYYLATYNDLQNAFGNDYEAARNHWLSNGINEGRHGSAQFASTFYLTNYGDIANAYGSTNYKDAILHYVSNGINEGRMGVSEAAASSQTQDQANTESRTWVQTPTDWVVPMVEEPPVVIDLDRAFKQIQESVQRYMHHEADKTTVMHYMNLVKQGYSLEQIDATVAKQGEFIASLFTKHLNREANGGDFAYWVNALVQIQDQTKLEELFVATAFPIVIEEPPVKTPTLPVEPTLVEVQEAQIREIVYRHMHHNADQPTVDRYMALLKKGHDSEYIDSVVEKDKQFISSLFTDYLVREANGGDYAHWMRVVSQSPNLEAAKEVFISNVYPTMEDAPRPIPRPELTTAVDPVWTSFVPSEPTSWVQSVATNGGVNPFVETVSVVKPKPPGIVVEPPIDQVGGWEIPVEGSLVSIQEGHIREIIQMQMGFYADQPMVDRYMVLLKKGHAQEYVDSTIVNDAQFIAGLFTKTLGREANSGDYAHWMNVLVQNENQTKLEEVFMSNVFPIVVEPPLIKIQEGDIREMIQRHMDFYADQATVDRYITLLKQGHSYEEIENTVYNDKKFVSKLFTNHLEREANGGDYAHWMNVLAQTQDSVKVEEIFKSAAGVPEICVEPLITPAIAYKPTADPFIGKNPVEPPHPTFVPSEPTSWVQSVTTNGGVNPFVETVSVVKPKPPEIAVEESLASIQEGHIREVIQMQMGFYADQPTVDRYMAFLKKGHAQEYVDSVIVNDAQFIAGLFTNTLGREANGGDYAHWMNVLVQNENHTRLEEVFMSNVYPIAVKPTMNPEGIVWEIPVEPPMGPVTPEDILARQEFLIRASVQRNLHYQADQETLDRYMELFKQGYDPEKVDATIAMQGEFISRLFTHHLGREANGGDFSYWVKALAQVQDYTKLEELFVATAFPIATEEPRERIHRHENEKLWKTDGDGGISNNQLDHSKPIWNFETGEEVAYRPEKHEAYDADTASWKTYEKLVPHHSNHESQLASVQDLNLRDHGSAPHYGSALHPASGIKENVEYLEVAQNGEILPDSVQAFKHGGHHPVQEHSLAAFEIPQDMGLPVDPGHKGSHGGNGFGETA